MIRFLRIDPRTLNCDLGNPLDSTWVHPESYDIANKLVENISKKACKHIIILLTFFLELLNPVALV